MPACVLPLLPGQPTLCSVAEGLDVFLAPVNDAFMQARIGTETVLLCQGDLVITQGERFGSKLGWVQGRRYLHMDDSGVPICVLNVSLRKQGRDVQAVASNVYTHPDHRRRGLAAGLMRRAKEDFPQLMADNALSEAGASLVGHATRKHRPGMR